jgi:hypothetical protein
MIRSPVTPLRQPLGLTPLVRPVVVEVVGHPALLT